jgi:hypothetical protein
MQGLATVLKGLTVMGIAGIGVWALLVGLSRARTPGANALAIGLGLFFLVGSALLFPRLVSSPSLTADCK